MHSLRFLTYLSLFLAALCGAWAEKWTRRATDKGESEAENMLGELGKVYLNGDGVKPDLEKAFGYYKTADAFLRIYGIDLNKLGALNMIYLDVQIIG